MKNIFETEHLIIRSFVPYDAKKLYQNHLEEALARWIPNERYQDIEEAENAIAFYSDCVQKRTLPYVLAIVLKETNELIGDTGINMVEGKEAEAEIGFSICESVSGRGYATEALRAMTEYAMTELGIKSLSGRVLNGNSASVRVLEKSGYTFIEEEFGAEDDPYGKGMMIFMKTCE